MKPSMLFPLSLLFGGAAHAASDEDCSFHDRIVQEDRSCEEGPHEASLEFVETDEAGEVTLRPEYAEMFELVQSYSPFTFELVSDGGDAEYDSDDHSGVSEAVQAWLNFLRLLLALSGELESLVTQVGTTGVYDGTLLDLNTGQRAEALLDLSHDQGGQITGTLWIIEGIELDGGLCPNYVVPTSGFRVNAQETGSHSGIGHSSRSVSLAGILSADVDIDFDFSLDTNDWETLTGDLTLDPLIVPCRTQQLFGNFKRRNDALISGS